MKHLTNRVVGSYPCLLQPLKEGQVPQQINSNRAEGHSSSDRSYIDIFAAENTLQAFEIRSPEKVRPSKISVRTVATAGLARGIIYKKKAKPTQLLDEDWSTVSVAQA